MRGRGLDAGPGRGAERLRVSRPWRRRGRRPHLLRVGGRLERHDAGLGVPPVRRAAVVRRLARVAPAREVGHPLEVELELAAAGDVGGGGRTRTALGRRRGGRCGRFSRDSVVQETGRRESPSRRARGRRDLILSLGGRSRCRSPRNVRHRRHRRGKSFVLELQLLKGEMVLFPPRPSNASLLLRSRRPSSKGPSVILQTPPAPVSSTRAGGCVAVHLSGCAVHFQTNIQIASGDRSRRNGGRPKGRYQRRQRGDVCNFRIREENYSWPPQKMRAFELAQIERQDQM